MQSAVNSCITGGRRGLRYVQMEITKLITILCCIYYTCASHHPHTIPVEGYETKLQDLGQHVEIPETPVKIIKITKTVAVKVPVPYPVKVIQKVPYPVHVAKPYPVPVTQIVKIPVPAKQHDHENNRHGVSALDSDHLQFNGNGNSQYQVQETPSHDSPAPDDHGYNTEGFGNDHSSDIPHGDSYGAPPSNYYNYSDDNDDSNLESQRYDQAIQSYLNKHNRNNAGPSHFGFH